MRAYARQMNATRNRTGVGRDIKQLKHTTGAPPSNGNGNPTVEREPSV